MQIGVVFPQIEFPSDAAAVRDYAQAVDDLGYTHMVAYDHVLGANPERPGGWRGAYTYRDPFLEPLVFFSYLAGFTRRVQFVPGVIILPQRQTALVAKQAATLDVLSGGRLRLGIGLGWNEVEYTALNEDFHTRGKRMEEQVDVLRRLWTDPLVTYDGRWHHIPDAGLNPLPVQRPIPLWFGGTADAGLRRAAQLGDGWLANAGSPAILQPQLAKLDAYLGEFGRARPAFGLETRIAYAPGDAAGWSAQRAAWEAMGVTHVDLNTMRAGFATAAEHIAAVRRFAVAMGLPAA
jgi:probable F420-dependent oxidoreductase